MVGVLGKCGEVGVKDRSCRVFGELVSGRFFRRFVFWGSCCKEFILI